MTFQSFLTFNDQYEVLLAMNYLMTSEADLFQKVFPGFDPAIHAADSGSFWIRRRMIAEGGPK